MYKRIFFCSNTLYRNSLLQTNKAGVQYSKNIIGIEKKLQRQIDSAKLQMEIYTSPGFYDSIAALTVKTEALVQEKKTARSAKYLYLMPNELKLSGRQ
ncbi:MAG: hypothetical protein HOP10_15825 [Chitinophagaceae bacterium]|nr:hypothetical protein [Chitinophagaceae bacterium]